MTLFALTGLLAAISCQRSGEDEVDAASREKVWQAIQPLAERYRIEPTFIYALVAAESNFDARAENGEARGLMQLKPSAWRAVTNKEPYLPTVWHWRRNLERGVEYLAWCRSTLHQKQKFSYPMLLAAFHYGIDHVQELDFNLRRIDPPDNAIYRRMWAGNLSPVPPPKMEIPR